MNYMDVKALSEVVEGYDALLNALRRVRRELRSAGIDTGQLLPVSIPLVRELCLGRKAAQRRYDAACDAYIRSLPAHGTGRAA